MAKHDWVKKRHGKTVKHKKEWEIEAQKTISRLHKILGAVARDIHQVGNASILIIKAKPIIDIVVAVNHFADVIAMEAKLKNGGLYYCTDANINA